MLRAAAAVTAGLLAAACGGGDAPESGPSADRTSYEAAGHSLWGRCFPGDPPTVVYLHGLGSMAADFADLTEQVLAQRPETAQCSYDRVNVGSSERQIEDRPLSDSVEELRAFIADADIEGPVVLVGASYGGLLAVAYAGSYPDDVEALVLADAPLPFEMRLFTPAVRRTIQRFVSGNQEHADLLEAYTTAARAELPDVPFVYVDATQQDLATQFGMRGYRPALEAYIDSLPQGELVLSDTDHLGVVDSPELADAIVGVLP